MIATERPLTNDERRELWELRLAETQNPMDMEDGSEQMLCSVLLFAAGFISGIGAVNLWGLL